MYTINVEYLSQDLVPFDIEAMASEDKIERILVWNNEFSQYIPFDALSKIDQAFIIDTIWERVTLELQADEVERKRIREGFNKIWTEITSASYAEWLNSRNI